MSPGLQGAGAAAAGLLRRCGTLVTQRGVAFPPGPLPVWNVRSWEEGGLLFLQLLLSLKRFSRDALTFDLSPQVDEQGSVFYEQTMREWLSCEEIVRQREKEQHAAALAKCSSGASMDSSSQKMIHHDSTVSNEVK